MKGNMTQTVDKVMAEIEEYADNRGDMDLLKTATRVIRIAQGTCPSCGGNVEAINYLLKDGHCCSEVTKKRETVVEGCGQYESECKCPKEE